MPSFPLLNTGAVCQYPTLIAHQQAVQILRFMDGSDQRFLNRGRQFRRWEVRLSLLSEPELGALEDFFKTQMGEHLKFTFLDPFSGSLVPNCVLGSPVLTSDFVELGSSSTSLWVVETNG